MFIKIVSKERNCNHAMTFDSIIPSQSIAEFEFLLLGRVDRFFPLFTFQRLAPHLLHSHSLDCVDCFLAFTNFLTTFVPRKIVFPLWRYMYGWHGLRESVTQTHTLALIK